MIRYTLKNKPTFSLLPMIKKTIVELAYIKEPFEVETQEGLMTISPETVEDWEDGYYLAYPEDGSKPYSISPKYVRDNYIISPTTYEL